MLNFPILGVCFIFIIIQIQHLLMLNILFYRYLYISKYSNTTLVNVKLNINFIDKAINNYSNTTLVNVKLDTFLISKSSKAIQIQHLLMLN